MVSAAVGTHRGFFSVRKISEHGFPKPMESRPEERGMHFSLHVMDLGYAGFE